MVITTVAGGVIDLSSFSSESFGVRYPLSSQGFKVTRQGTSRMACVWKPITAQRRLSMVKDNGIGIQLAQLGLAASAVVSLNNATPNCLT